MTFKNLPDKSAAQRGEPVPEGGDISRQPDAAPDHPMGASDREASSGAFDSLHDFCSEDADDASGAQAIGSENRQTSRDAAVPIGDPPGPDMNSTAVDGLRAQLRQTETDLERLKRDAATCRGDLRRLCDLLAQLRQEYTRRETEDHDELAARRPLSAPAVRVAMLADDTHVFRPAGQAVGHPERPATDAAADSERLDIRCRGTRDTLAGASGVGSSIVHTLVRTSDAGMPVTPAVLPDLGAMADPARHALTTRVAIPSRAMKSRAPARPWVPVVGVLVAVFAVGVVRVRDLAAPGASPGRRAQRDPTAPEPVAALPGRSLAATIFVMTQNGPAAVINSRATNDGTTLAQLTKGVAQPETARAVSTSGSAPQPPTGRSAATEPLRENRTRQRFIGDLRVESLPTGAAVFINQRPAGRTPLQVRRLRAGSHVIRIEHEGYERWTTAALVPTAHQARVRAKLQPLCCPNYGH